MTRIEGEIVIAASPDRVFDYVTNPATWIKWYPLTTGVEWAHGRPAKVGETWDEHVHMLLAHTQLPIWKGVFSWRVVATDRPTRFVYDGVAKGDGLFKSTGGGTAEIVYELSEVKGGTRFHRQLDYKEPNLVLEIFDKLVFHHIIEHASGQALAQLKKALESAS